MFLALPAGRYCERHGLKRPIVWSVTAAVAGCALAAAWPVFPVLCASALLTGRCGRCLEHRGSAPHSARRGRPSRAAQGVLVVGDRPGVVQCPGPGRRRRHDRRRRVSRRRSWRLPRCRCSGWLAVRGAPNRVSMPAEAAHRPGGAWDLWRDPGPAPAPHRVTCLLSSCWDVHAFLVPVLGHERGLPGFGDRRHPGRIRHRRRRRAAPDAAGRRRPARVGDPWSVRWPQPPSCSASIL